MPQLSTRTRISPGPIAGVGISSTATVLVCRDRPRPSYVSGISAAHSYVRNDSLQKNLPAPRCRDRYFDSAAAIPGTNRWTDASALALESAYAEMAVRVPHLVEIHAILFISQHRKRPGHSRMATSPFLARRHRRRLHFHRGRTRSRQMPLLARPSAHMVYRHNRPLRHRARRRRASLPTRSRCDRRNTSADHSPRPAPRRIPCSRRLRLNPSSADGGHRRRCRTRTVRGQQQPHSVQLGDPRNPPSESGRIAFQARLRIPRKLNRSAATNRTFSLAVTVLTKPLARPAASAARPVPA